MTSKLAAGQALAAVDLSTCCLTLPTSCTSAHLLQIGADVIELGVPYSDPLADGPTIQAAATRALQQGTTLDKVRERAASPAAWL